MCVSFVMLLTAAIDVDGTHMSHDNIRDLFVCRVWLSRLPLWALMATSTYGILTVAFERYIAVIYPIWYNVRMKKCISKTTPILLRLTCIYYRAMHYSAKRVRPIETACHLFVCPSVRPSVRLSVCDVGGSGQRRLEILETKCTNN